MTEMHKTTLNGECKTTGSQIVQEFLNNKTKWDKIKFWFLLRWSLIRPYFPYSKHIWRLRLNGFNPIAFCDYAGEDTWIFETQQEADDAYNKMEIKKGCCVGWWYGKQDLLNYLKEDDFFFRPKVRWHKKGNEDFIKMLKEH
jgi:hypothetical protein